MILSRQNSLIKLVKSLSDKKYRDIEGLYIVEGVKMVKEAVDNGLDIYRVIATPSCVEKYGAVIDLSRAELVEESVFNSVSNETTPQGVIALVKKPLNEITVPSGKCLYLDGVSDPANIGAIIRTAAASGYNDIYMCSCADCFSPKAVRASMSGIFKVKTHIGSSEELLSKINLPIVVADMNGENVFEKNSIPKDFCLVIGNEGKGVSAALREKADYTVKIPMQNGMESLNAAVSAGIIMYGLVKE